MLAISGHNFEALRSSATMVGILELRWKTLSTLSSDRNKCIVSSYHSERTLAMFDVETDNVETYY